MIVRTPALLKICAAATMILSLAATSSACTRLLLNSKGKTVAMARTMDLFITDNATLVTRPRGARYTSPLTGNPVSWTSKYGSVDVTGLGVATSDGMNEKGLVANLLYLDKSGYEAPDNRKNLSVAVWAQYVLDNYATVQEAIAHLNDVRVAPAHIAGHDWPLHLSLEDPSGDSAIIEFVNGKPLVHHGRQYTVMTNEPAMNVQLANLKNYKLFGGKLPLPGDVDPQDRFVRVASFEKMLPMQKTPEETVASAVNIVRVALVPEGAEDTSGHENSVDSWPTRWVTAADLTHKIYYVQAVQSPYAFWVDLTKVNFGAPGSHVALDVYNPRLSGDVTSRYTAPPQSTGE